MFRVKMIRGAGFTDSEWNEQLDAAYWWAKCWNDAGFQGQVVNYRQTRSQCTGSLWWKKCVTVPGPLGFTYTDDTAAAVSLKMLSGAESLKPDADGTANVTVVMGNESGVLGWTNPGTLIEWLSQWFVDDSTIAAQAGNRAHEYMHKLGYDHPYRITWDRPFSVPYAIGDMVEAWVLPRYVAGEYAAHVTTVVEGGQTVQLIQV